MPWYKFVHPKPSEGLYSWSRFYIEGVNEDTVFLGLESSSIKEEWFDSEVDASEVPGPESTCSLNEKFKPEGYVDTYVSPLEEKPYLTHRWSDYGFVIAGYGFTYDADENIVSDVCASNPEGRRFDGARTFEFITPEFDLSMYQTDNTSVTVGEFDEGIKFQKTIYRSEEDEFVPSVYYTFWAEDRDVVVEYQEKLSLIADDLKDLVEARNEMLEGFC